MSLATFRVVTANILKPDNGEPEHAWVHRRDRCIEKRFKYAMQTSIGLQEARSTQVSDLLSVLPTHAAITTPRTLPNGPPVNTIIYNITAFKLRAHSAFWLSETPWAPGSNGWKSGSIRLVQWADLEHSCGRRVLHQHPP